MRAAAARRLRICATAAAAAEVILPLLLGRPAVASPPIAGIGTGAARASLDAG